MIDFRYHVISIVAIFLALATGVALGAGPLHGEFTQRLADEADRDREAKEDLRSQLSLVESQASFTDTVAGQLGDRLVEGRLTERAVAVITLPGASADTVEALQEQVDASGGTVTSTVDVLPKLLDPENRQLAEGLATSVLGEIPDIEGTQGATSYQLVGVSLARALLTGRGSGEPTDSPARTIIQGYTEAEFITSESEVERRAGLAIVVAGEPSEEAIAGQDELVATLAQSMDANSAGLVVVGPTSAAQTDGYVAAIRDSDVSEEVSTVDSANTRAGQVVSVMALSQQAGGGVGQYGAVDGSETSLAELLVP